MFTKLRKIKKLRQNFNKDLELKNKKKQKT